MTWLTPDERQAWIGLQVCVSSIEHACDKQLRRDAQIPFTTYSILAGLSDGDCGPRHMSDLAGIAGHSQSRLSHAVNRLETEGLVRRSGCPGDRRAVHAELTDAGRRVVEHAAPAHVKAVREMVFDRLTPEESAQLTASMRVLYRLLADGGLVPAVPGLLAG